MGMFTRGGRKLFGERITVPLPEETPIHYLRATLSDLINGHVFFKLEFRTRETVVFEDQDYRTCGDEAISAVLERGTAFGVDVVVIVGTMPNVVNPRDEEDELPYRAGRTYIRRGAGFQLLQEYPIEGESWSAVAYAIDLAKRHRRDKTPNERTLDATEEARAISASNKRETTIRDRDNDVLK
ncbi:hypothetical protein HFO56_02760 [Rhizobium laguerreae]|uniref:hypothetical protein n=1 Tax=Rhizobium laguerreae TaxID=1076926 RepID=UPI001C908D72|nr:hypothetical protein [Rhizobium laguerreae]MBY3151307.1 hypothetical protein [Rhizobium laguerreae]